MLTLQHSIQFAQPFVQYVPITAGAGQEPATSIGTMIRNSFLGAPLVWNFNRNEITFSTVVKQQDYSQSFSANGNDFGFIEEASLTDDQGNTYYIKDVYNTATLGVATASPAASGQRPSGISVKNVSYASGTQTVIFRFIGVPDAVYTVSLTYQKRAPIFGPFFLSAAGNAAGGNTAYTGVFDPYSFPVGATAIITGFGNAANNGSFTVVSCTTTLLTVSNAVGVAQTQTAYATNFDWSPIPDIFSDVYNNLFLSEILAMSDDARAQLYRQRGVAAFLSRASGLTETQKNAFAQQWLARDRERGALLSSGQQGVQARGV